MIADRIAIYSVLLPLFILSSSGLSPPQRLPQWLRSSKRAMDDGRRERRAPLQSSLSSSLFPAFRMTQREESLISLFFSTIFILGDPGAVRRIRRNKLLPRRFSGPNSLPMGLRWCMARNICGEGNQAMPGTNHNQTSSFTVVVVVVVIYCDLIYHQVENV